MPLTIDLSNYRALVTGVSSGIGAGIADMLAQAGCDLAGCGLESADSEEVQRFVATVERHGRSAFYQSLDISDAEWTALADANADMLARLARVASVEFAAEPLTGSNARSTSGFDVAVVYERQIDVAAERERLTKDLAKLEKGLTASERQLGNEAFIAKAPAHIVEGLKKQAAETKMLYEKARAALEGLPVA